MEQDERETAGSGTGAGVTRSQNVVMTLPHDWSQIGRFLRPALERVADSARETQLLVLTPDADSAVAVARTALFGDDTGVDEPDGDDEAADEADDADEDEGDDRESAAASDGDRAAADDDERYDDEPDVLAVTSARRATRQLRERGAAGSAPSVVTGTPTEIVALIRASAIKLSTVRTLIVAWADEILDAGGAADLEAVMAEIPKEAARVLVTGAASDEVDAIVERYMRRARRVGESVVGEDATPVTLHYVSVSASSRPAALRRLLDELDPPSAVVIARTSDSQAEALDALRAIGYRDEDEGVIVSDGDVTENTAVVVFYDVPPTRAALDAALAAAPVQVIALAQPRQLAHLRALTAGGRVLAHTLPEAAARARKREERVRAELRALLATGVPARELVVLEPLLDEFDGVEIAAAALRLAERERERSAQLLSGTHTGVTAKGTGGAAQSAAGVAAGQWKRIFMTIGEIDGVRSSDVVSAVTAQGGLAPDKVGKVEMRENHSLVEVAAEEAERVAEKLNGASIKGRRVVARLDQDRASREGGAAAPRRSAGGDRPQRSDRGGFERGGAGRGFDRGAGRGGAGPRGRPDDRGERRPSFDRGAPRGERPDRGAPRGDRPERGPRPGGAGGDRFKRGGERGGGGGFGRGARGDMPERGPRAANEREEWQGRADRLRQSRPRPRNED